MPLKIALAAVEVAKLSLPAAEKGNLYAVSDAGVAVLLADAAAQAAALNVKINLAWIEDEQLQERRVGAHRGGPVRDRAAARASPGHHLQQALEDSDWGGRVAAKIIDGKAVAEELRAELARELEELKAAGAKPGIATLMVGEDFGAGMYRGAVEKFCGEMGLGYRNETLPADAGEAAVIKAVESLNADPAVSGILPLRPFPAQISDSVVINSIDLDKDVDCFHPSNMGRLTLGEPTFPPATPAACMELLERYLQGRRPRCDRGARRRRGVCGGALQHGGQAARPAAAQPQRHHHGRPCVHF